MGMFQAVRRRLTVSDDESYIPDSDEEDDQAIDRQDTSSHKKGVFIDAEAMKEKVRANLALDRRDTTAHFKATGKCAYIAKHVMFERAMLAIIAMNAVWIAVDTDHNSAEVLIMASPVFIVAENLFCSAFSFEWTVRFFSFQKKKYALKDTWFIFDSVMVLMMVLETWVMSLYLLLSDNSSSASLGNSSILKMARLMRLSRMARMARLLRAMPELMIMVKGMITAVRSVAITLTLLILIMYAFGIAFCQMTKGAEVGQMHFDSVLDSMYTLGLYGTLLDNIKYMADELGKENYLLASLFFLYVLLTAFTVMNMLIGVLCEVVSAVAATEREEIKISYVKSKVLKVVEEIDQDGDRHITKTEMVDILNNASACRALKEVGVDVMSLVDNADAIFVDVKGRELAQLSFGDFMNVVLSLRGSNNATVKDMVELRKSLRIATEDIVEKVIQSLEQKLSDLKPHRSELQSRSNTIEVSAKMLQSRSNTVQSFVPPSRLSDLPAERLELEGNWCQLGEPKAPEVPDFALAKIPGCAPRKRSGGKLPQLMNAVSEPDSTAPSAQEKCSWRDLPQAVPEEYKIPDRPPVKPSKLLTSTNSRPPPLEEPSWHEMPPPLARIPTTELAPLCGPPLPTPEPVLPGLVLQQAPGRQPTVDPPTPGKWAKAPDVPLAFPFASKSPMETCCEDTSEATCTPGSAEDSRCGHISMSTKLPPLTPEAGGWCPVGALQVELRGHMAELTKSLTAGLCQVKRLEERILERLRTTTRSAPQTTPAPTSLPPLPLLALSGQLVTGSSSVELE